YDKGDGRDQYQRGENPLHDRRSASIRLSSLSLPAASPGVALRPPNRRSRFWYSNTACSRSVRVKSGHSVSVTYNSEYAICHSRKLEMRISPDVRIRRSGSGQDAV